MPNRRALLLCGRNRDEGGTPSVQNSAWDGRCAPERGRPALGRRAAPFLHAIAVPWGRHLFPAHSIGATITGCIARIAFNATEGMEGQTLYQHANRMLGAHRESTFEALARQAGAGP